MYYCTEINNGCLSKIIMNSSFKQITLVGFLMLTSYIFSGCSGTSDKIRQHDEAVVKNDSTLGDLFAGIKKIKPQTIIFGNIKFGMSRDSIKRILLAKLQDSEILYINDKGFYYQAQNSKIGDSLTLGSFNLCYYAEPIFYNYKLGEIKIRQFLDFDYSNVVSFFKVNSTNSGLEDIRYPYKSLYNITKQILYSKYRSHDSISVLVDENPPSHTTFMFAPDFYIEANDAVGEINLQDFNKKFDNRYYSQIKLKPSDLFENKTFDFSVSPGFVEVPGEDLLIASINYICPSITAEGHGTALYPLRVQEQEAEKDEKEQLEDLRNQKIKDSLENTKREMDAKGSLKF